MKEFQEKIQKQFTSMCESGKLFRANVTGQSVWEHYLLSFEEDPVFRDPNSTEHNCNHCKNFIRRYGNVVSINDKFEIVTMFDIDIEGEYKPTAVHLSNVLKSSKIKDVFFETFDELNSLPYEACTKHAKHFQLGTAKNIKRYTKEEAEKFGVVKPNETRTFDHMYLSIPKQFVDMSGKSIESITGEYRDNRNVFHRGMAEIPLDTLELVRDLIKQGSLLDGATHLHKIDKIIPYKQQFNTLHAESAAKAENWSWVISYQLPIAKFKNELIGVLCTELAEGKELNEACQSWNKRVDPANYMKASAPITKKQIEEARKFIEENGFTESFNRRFATLLDIKVSEILHVNNGDGAIKNVSIFDGVKPTSTRHKRSEFDGIETVGIEKFMADILPGCTSVEAFLSNNHDNNMVTLTTSKDENSKPIFKWDNNYSWTFNGNLAGKSQIKETVKMHGGNVGGVLRFSIMWNEGGQDNSDLDAWCSHPGSVTIGYSTGYRKDRGGSKSPCSGQLDVDNTHPGGKLAVENIVFDDIKKLKNGTYKFWVNPFGTYGFKGFKAEIEFEGETFNYEYNSTTFKTNVVVAEVTVKDGKMSIKHVLPEAAVTSKEIYGLETNKFHKVNLVCLSPNHWGNNNVGNKHYMFMLEGCKTAEHIRGFHNENLISDLLTHRKVIEVLGNTSTIPPTEDQLSGLGFNATVRDELVVKLQGTHKRMVKIIF